MQRMPALALALLVLGLATLGLASPAGAAQTVTLHTSFSPDRPGASTTITFGFTIAGSEGRAPSPLLGIDLHLPAGLGLARNTLGLAECEPQELYVEGPEGCPANSHVGFGSAVAEVPYGPEIVFEEAQVYAYRGETVGDHVTILFFTEALGPVYAALVFPGALIEDTGPFSGSIDTEVPLIPSVPGGPNVSVQRFQSTFGPKGLAYEREVNGRIVNFEPRGVTVPRQCPPGGYQFAADFAFEDGSRQTVHSTAPCPAPEKLPRSKHRARRPGQSKRR
jgi:hypothetical protein